MSLYSRSKTQIFKQIDTGFATLQLLIIAARPQEWIKNVFLFAALLFSKNLLNPTLSLRVLVAFALYCLNAGGVYFINDILDRDEDKHHPQKSTRPIASGALPVALAAPVAVFMLVVAMSGALLLNLSFGLITGCYILLNLTYSKWFKHIVILDVFAVASGFVLRVAAGAAVIDVTISDWLLICTLLLALFLGFSKRRHELVTLEQDASRHRPVLKEYSPLFLDMMIGIVTASTVMGYTLYTISDETVRRLGTDRLILTVPCVLYGIFRYLYLVYRQNYGGNPAQVLLTDGPLLINVLLWAIISGLIIHITG
jgi:4-hydroxybenzoate polyprenyltransferase